MKRLIENRVYEHSARLLAVQHAVAEIAGGKSMDMDPAALRDAVRQVRQAIGAIAGAYATFIGGLAVQQLGYERWTEDIDVLVDAAHFGALLEELRRRGFTLEAGFTLRHTPTGVQLDLLKEGTRLKGASAPFPHPRDLGAHGGYATLSGIIRLKLASGRMQDAADVVELLKRHITEAAEVEVALPEAARGQFKTLLEQAQRERA